MVGHRGLVDVFRLEIACRNFCGDVSRGISDFCPRSVIQREAQSHSRVVFAHGDRLVDLVEHSVREPFPPTDHGKPQSLFENRAAILDKKLFEQTHQPPQFGLGPFPVFAAQAVKRQLLKTDFGTELDALANALDASPMPLDARQPASFCPPTIAIHYDGHVFRHRFGKIV